MLNDNTKPIICAILANLAFTSSVLFGAYSIVLSTNNLKLLIYTCYGSLILIALGSGLLGTIAGIRCARRTYTPGLRMVMGLCGLLAISFWHYILDPIPVKPLYAEGQYTAMFIPISIMALAFGIYIGLIFMASNRRVPR